MRVMVLNKAVETGKSTIARHMLAGPLDAILISVVGDFEADGHPDSRCLRKNSSELPRILSHLPNIPNVVIDIGSEDHGVVMNQLAATPDYHELFDFIVVPVTARQSAQNHTADTILTLADHCVPARKVRVLFNMMGLGRNGDVYDDFAPLLDFYGRDYNEGRPKFEFRPEAVLHEHEAIDSLKRYGHAIPEQIVNFERANYRKQLVDATAEHDETKITVMTKLIEYETQLKRLKRELDHARGELLMPAEVVS